MGRNAKVRWRSRDQAWASDVGERYQDKAGKWRNKTVFFRGIPRADVGAAYAALASHLALRRLDLDADPGEPFVAEVCAAYLVWSVAHTKGRTAEGVDEMLEKWKAWRDPGDKVPMELRLAKDVRAADLRGMLAAWAKEGYSPHYRARLCRTVKACWRWASEEQPDRPPLIAVNPLAAVKGPAVPRAPERYATRQEVAAFLRFAWRRAGRATPLYRRFGRLLVLLVRVAAHTGARPGELCDARWSDLDAARGTITLPPDRHKTGGKTGKPRVIFLPRGIVRALERERRREDRHETNLFVHKRGKGGVARGATRGGGEPWDSRSLAKAVAKVRNEAAAAGLPIETAGDQRFVLYRLRHTSMTEDLMSGGDAATVAELHGTSVRVIETTYSHLQEDHLSRAAAGLAARRRKGSGG